jgi:hypothetical protein
LLSLLLLQTCALLCVGSPKTHHACAVRLHLEVGRGHAGSAVEHLSYGHAPTKARTYNSSVEHIPFAWI